MSNYTVELENLLYGRVTGRFVAIVNDGEDSNTLPDAVPMNGTVTFTASVSHAQNEAISTTLFPEPIECVLDRDGYLTYGGTRGVDLLASDNLNPKGWAWRVDFNLRAGVHKRSHKSFYFENPSGRETDLSQVTPVVNPAGEPVVGIPGVGIKEVFVTEDGDIVFRLTDGTELPPVMMTDLGEAAVSMQALAAAVSAASKFADDAEKAQGEVAVYHSEVQVWRNETLIAKNQSQSAATSAANSVAQIGDSVARSTSAADRAESAAIKADTSATKAKTSETNSKNSETAAQSASQSASSNASTVAQQAATVNSQSQQVANDASNTSLWAQQAENAKGQSQAAAGRAEAAVVGIDDKVALTTSNAASANTSKIAAEDAANRSKDSETNSKNSEVQSGTNATYADQRATAAAASALSAKNDADRAEAFADQVESAAGGNWYAKPTNGIPAADMSQDVQTRLAQGASASQPGHVHEMGDISGLQAALSGFYKKPAGGIPEADLSAGVKAKLNASMTELPDHKHEISDVNGLQTALDDKYQKPEGGIPVADLSDGVKTSIQKGESASQPGHKHAASDIEGTLAESQIPGLPASKISTGSMSVPRGGTGASTLPQGNYLVGNGSGAVQSKTPSEVKGDLALDAVDNTRDNAKPISQPQADGLAAKSHKHLLADLDDVKIVDAEPAVKTPGVLYLVKG